MRAEIISVGTELLLGDILNTNARYLARELAGLGYTVYYQTVVGDNPVRLRSLVQQAKERSDILLFTGGLGPTEDDLTKETVAAVFGDTLVLDPDILAEMEAFFASFARTMTDNNRKQALVPRNGGVLPNPNGTAPGVSFRQGDKYAFLLPGPPGEMQPMFQNHVKPILERMQDAAIRSLTLRVFGVGESDLEVRVQELLEGSNPTAALYAKTGEVHIRITARAASAQQADMMCAEYAGLFRAILGDVIYSDSDEELEDAVVRILAENRETVATAESCTGGMLAQRLTAVPGSSAVFGFGTVSYANKFKQSMLGVKAATLRRYGAVSSQVAAEMAAGAAKRANANYGVGITGVAGPGGGTEEKPVGLVYVAAWAKNRVYIKKLQIAGRPREFVRRMATQHALDMVRRLALGLALPGAKMFTAGQEPDFDRQSSPKRKGAAAGRGLLSFLAVGVIIALVLVLLNQFGVFGGTPQEQDATGLAELEGLAYGTSDFTQAAQVLVAKKQADDAAVAGLLALPDGLQRMVVTTGHGQSTLEALDQWPGLGLAANIAPDAAPDGQGHHTLILGGLSLAPLFSYIRAAEAGSLQMPPPATFTYFTANTANIYKTCGVYLLDTDETQPDGFDPGTPLLASSEAYLNFVLGVRMRSLYDLPVSQDEGDSFFSLAAEDPDFPGRRVYLCGRRLAPAESTAANPVALAGAPLMPAAWYTQTGKPAPNTKELQNFWGDWYPWRNSNNAALQAETGAPPSDFELPTKPDPPAGSEASVSSSSASGSAEAAESAIDSVSPASGSGSASAGLSQGQEQSLPADQSELLSAPQSDAGNTPPPAFEPDSLTVTMNGRQMTADTTTVLAMVCQWEAGAMEDPAIQAVAIAAHSWLRSQQAAGNPAPPVLGLPATAKVTAAVAPVARLILTDPGASTAVSSGRAGAAGTEENQPENAGALRPAFTPYCPMAATGTNSPASVWGEAATRAYLPQVSSPHDQSRLDWRHSTTLSQQQMQTLLRRYFAVGDAGAPETWFADMQKDESGYLLSASLAGQEVSGRELWRVLSAEGAVRSPAFDIEFNGTAFLLTSYGVGHGCGLSVAGAQGYALQGWGHTDILAHYYPGAHLVNLE